MRKAWWLKIFLKLVLSRLPISYRFWSSIGVFKHGSMNTTDYGLNVFLKHLDRSSWGRNLQGRVVLELGPGDGVASAIIAASFGGRAILVDVGNFADREPSSYFDLYEKLRTMGLNPPDIKQCKTIEDILALCNGVYLTEGIKSLRRLESASVDMVFSHAVLEHVRLHEFSDTMKELRRIVKPDGYCSHEIDLRDHLGGGLNNLRFSNKLWESNFFAQSGFYTNRIRFSEMMKIFEESKLKADTVHTQCWDKLPLSKRKMARNFRGFQDQDLLVSTFSVTLLPF